MLMKPGWPTGGTTTAGNTGVPDTPRSFRVAFGSVVLVAASLVASLVPAHDAGWRFAILATVVGGFAAVTLDQIGLAAVMALAFLINDGFFENRFGTLSWHGSVDMLLVGVLVVVGTLGLAAGEAYRQVRALRHRRHRT
jgi:hypothetical protein